MNLTSHFGTDGGHFCYRSQLHISHVVYTTKRMWFTHKHRNEAICNAIRYVFLISHLCHTAANQRQMLFGMHIYTCCLHFRGLDVGSTQHSQDLLEYKIECAKN